MTIALLIFAGLVLGAGACAASYRQGRIVAERDAAREDVRIARFAKLASDLALATPMSRADAERAIARALEVMPPYTALTRPRPVRPSPMAREP